MAQPPTPVRTRDASTTRTRWSKSLPGVIVALVTFIGAASVSGFVANLWSQSSVDTYVAQTRDLRALQSALIDTNAAVDAYLLDPDPGALDRVLASERRLSATDPAVLLLLQEEGAGGAVDQRHAAALTTLMNDWAKAVRLAESRNAAEGVQLLKRSDAAGHMALLRASTDRAVTLRSTAAATLQQTLSSALVRLFGSVIALTVVAMTAMVMAFRNGEREARGRERAIVDSRAAHDRIQHLFFMADMLQSAASHEDTNAVLRATAAHLLPGCSGAMYVFNNSRDRLDLATRWGDGSQGSADHFHPDGCWALKRGKTNMNGAMAGGLRCDHVLPDQVTLEIPMIARGQLHGLIEVIAEGADASERLQEIRPVAAAIGDAMSLSLSGMALRERLRNQALKDSLTGLYNRRFLEETLERLCLDAERRRAPLSAIMIDLDHFKRLNDLHGHAVGDSALREVAKTVLLNLRSTDIACRYGGEELAVLLPDCPLAMAERKAEQIRAAIAELTIQGAAVTASLGVACLPETSARSELLTNADAALYQAKQNGRDRVAVATARPSARFSVVEGGSSVAEAC